MHPTGSGHFLVAAAQRIARRLAVIRTGETDPAPNVFRHALRQVIGRCIFGVDLNPMAVELCKVSLWLESVEPGRPLSFLDHHIVCGNSLLGASPEQVQAGIPDDAYKELTGDLKAVVSSYRKQNAAERSGQASLSLWGDTTAEDRLALTVAELDALDDSDLAGVRAKETQWHSILQSEAMTRALFAANAWCAAFVVPKSTAEIGITTATIRRALDDGSSAIAPQVVNAVAQMTEEYRFLHFHIAFPQVFATATDGADDELLTRRGFDAVLGNPPWEKVKLAEKEFFASRAPEIAASAGSTRKRMISKLAESDPPLFATFQHALRHAEAESSFLRFSGRYPLNGRGDVNTYAVFAELMRASTAPTGRCGVIVPSGIATDDTTKYFFADIVNQQALASLYEFENEGFFQDVGQGHMNRFCLLTLAGGAEQIPRAEYMFRGTSLLDLLDSDRRFTLTAEELGLVNPNTHTCPVFRNQRDAELTIDIYQHVPVILAKGPPVHNPWQITLSTMFHMTNDSSKFRTASQCEHDGATLVGNIYQHPDGRKWLPLYEGKMIGHFDHRRGDYQLLKPGDKGHVLPSPSVTSLQNPDYMTLPRYWVASDMVRDYLSGRWTHSWLLGVRDIAGSRADARTVIPCVIPRAAVGNKLPLLLSEAPAKRVALLGAYLSSFVFDFVARQKVGGNNLNFFIIEQFPILPPEDFDQLAPWHTEMGVADWIAPRVLELTYTAWDLAGFAKDLGFVGPPFKWNDERRSMLRAELDACYFLLYGIRRDDVAYMMDAFPIVQKRDETAFGEYRTARLILERFDAMSKAIETGSAYQGILE